MQWFFFVKFREYAHFYKKSAAIHPPWGCPGAQRSEAEGEILTLRIRRPEAHGRQANPQGVAVAGDISLPSTMEKRPAGICFT